MAIDYKHHQFVSVNVIARDAMLKCQTLFSLINSNSFITMATEFYGQNDMDYVRSFSSLYARCLSSRSFVSSKCEHSGLQRFAFVITHDHFS